MHITEFIGIYLVILWDKINSFCGRFREHAPKSPRLLAWEQHCRAEDVEHSEGRDREEASARLKPRRVASDLRSFLSCKSDLARGN